MRVKSAELKDKFLLEGFMAFFVSQVSPATPGKYNQLICGGQAWFPVTWLCIKVKSRCGLEFEITRENLKLHMSWNESLLSSKIIKTFFLASLALLCTWFGTWRRFSSSSATLHVRRAQRYVNTNPCTQLFAIGNPFFRHVHLFPSTPVSYTHLTLPTKLEV